MRLYEFVESDAQVIGIIKPILLRAKAEGANSISTRQLSNDINDDAVTSDVLVNILNKHRSVFKNIISSVSIDEIILNADGSKERSDYDKKVASLKKTAVKQAMDELE
jgi:hypothetical protein